MTLASKLQQLNKLRPLSPEAVASLSEAWDVRMVYESNSIEGNSLTLRETELVLSKGVTVSGKSVKDHIETVNLASAWEAVKSLAQPGTGFTEKDLLELHRIVLMKAGETNAGIYRSGAVRIAGANHIPPNPVKVPDLMESAFAESQDLDAVAKAAKIHHAVASIHPFVDGNGRAARLAMNFILIAAGYPPVSIPTDLREEYYNALEAADSGNYSEWQSFIETQLHQEFDYYLEALSPSMEEPCIEKLVGSLQEAKRTAVQELQPNRAIPSEIKEEIQALFSEAILAAKQSDIESVRAALQEIEKTDLLRRGCVIQPLNEFLKNI